MSQHVVHFLGFMGLVETIVEFVYIFALRKAFTPFEGIFFLTDGSCEMLGEVFAVVLGGRHVFQEYRGNVNVVDMFVVALKDPMHNMAYPHPSSEEPDLGLLSAASVGITVSNLSLFFWAIFLPFWGDFQGEDVSRVLLSALSCLFVTGVLVVNALDARRIQARGETTVSDRTWICAFSAKYALRKAFGVYLVISNSDRLAPDELGYALIGFQVLELASVLLVLLKALITDVYDGVAAEMPRQVGERCFDVLNCMSSCLRCFESFKTATVTQGPPHGKASTQLAIHGVSDVSDGFDKSDGFVEDCSTGSEEKNGVGYYLGLETANYTRKPPPPKPEEESASPGFSHFSTGYGGPATLENMRIDLAEEEQVLDDLEEKPAWPPVKLEPRPPVEEKPKPPPPVEEKPKLPPPTPSELGKSVVPRADSFPRVSSPKQRVARAHSFAGPFATVTTVGDEWTGSTVRVQPDYYHHVDSVDFAEHGSTVGVQPAYYHHVDSVDFAEHLRLSPTSTKRERRWWWWFF